jgi:hypothetical protein
MNQIDMISHRLMIYGGIIMYVLGSIGNILNICVFTLWSRSKKSSNKSCHSSRTNNSSLYLLTSSLSNLIVVLYPLFTRILLDGYKYEITENSVFILCKFRYYILHTFDLISLTCICLAIFDRYLISSREVRLRKLSLTKKRTKLILLLISCLFGIHSIPIIKYYSASITGHCIITSTIYLYYYLYTFQIVLHGLLPISFLSVFGILTFRQLRVISKRKNSSGSLNSDKQLSRMLLLMSLAIVLSSIPYCIEQSYYVLFNGNNRQQKSYFFLYHVICSILFYANPVSSFYIYYISTPNFRIQVQKIIFCRKHVHCVVFYQVKPNTPRPSIDEII